jgi:hypothetical protein
MRQAAGHGIDPNTATTTRSEYSTANMKLALRGLEGKTTDPYLAGWRKRVVPSLGHLPITMITKGAVDRAVHAWIADDCGRSTAKNSLVVLVRVMEQAHRDGIIDRNPARISGWQREYKPAEDELDDPRSLALPDWSALVTSKIEDALKAAGIDSVDLAKASDDEDAVCVGTMHRMKGLEFRCMCVAGVSAKQVPAAIAVTPIEDDKQTHQQDLEREKCLLFVACTRAREELLVTWHGEPSPFLTTLI